MESPSFMSRLDLMRSCLMLNSQYGAGNTLIVCARWGGRSVLMDLVGTDTHYVPWTAPNFDADSHQSYHGWGLVKKHPMQNFRPLEQQEPLSGWPWSFHRNLWQRQNLHNRNIDSNANSIQTSTSPWRRFLLSQRPKILHGMFFYQASTVVRLVRAIVKVWGASRDVLYMILESGKKMKRRTWA